MILREEVTTATGPREVGALLDVSMAAGVHDPRSLSCVDSSTCSMEPTSSFSTTAMTSPSRACSRSHEDPSPTSCFNARSLLEKDEHYKTASPCAWLQDRAPGDSTPSPSSLLSSPSNGSSNSISSDNDGSSPSGGLPSRRSRACHDSVASSTSSNPSVSVCEYHGGAVRNFSPPCLCSSALMKDCCYNSSSASAYRCIASVDPKIETTVSVSRNLLPLELSSLSPPYSPLASPTLVPSPCPSVLSMSLLSPPRPAAMPASSDSILHSETYSNTPPSALNPCSPESCSLATTVAAPPTSELKKPQSLTLTLPPRGNHLDFRRFGYKHLCALSQGRHGCAHLVQGIWDWRLWVAKVVDLCELSPRQRRLALEEARHLKRLEHPYIVRYKESFVSDDGCYLIIVMEYCEGGDLFTHIVQTQEKGQLITERQVLTWFGNVVMGLQYMHSMQVLHCDLKTTNIFLTSDGKAKIGDLGISRMLKKDTYMSSPVSRPRGTPLYMSPEMTNCQALTDKSDCWSLGCVLYEMCCLAHAFSDGRKMCSTTSGSISWVDGERRASGHTAVAAAEVSSASNTGDFHLSDRHTDRDVGDVSTLVPTSGAHGTLQRPELALDCDAASAVPTNESCDSSHWPSTPPQPDSSPKRHCGAAVLQQKKEKGLDALARSVENHDGDDAEEEPQSPQQMVELPDAYSPALAVLIGQLLQRQPQRRPSVDEVFILLQNNLSFSTDDQSPFTPTTTSNSSRTPGGTYSPPSTTTPATLPMTAPQHSADSTSCAILTEPATAFSLVKSFTEKCFDSAASPSRTCANTTRICSSQFANRSEISSSLRSPLPTSHSNNGQADCFSNNVGVSALYVSILSVEEPTSPCPMGSQEPASCSSELPHTPSSTASTQQPSPMLPSAAACDNTTAATQLPLSPPSTPTNPCRRSSVEFLFPSRVPRSLSGFPEKAASHIPISSRDTPSCCCIAKANVRPLTQSSDTGWRWQWIDTLDIFSSQLALSELNCEATRRFSSMVASDHDYFTTSVSPSAMEPDSLPINPPPEISCAAPDLRQQRPASETARLPLTSHEKDGWMNGNSYRSKLRDEAEYHSFYETLRSYVKGRTESTRSPRGGCLRRSSASAGILFYTEGTTCCRCFERSTPSTFLHGTDKNGLADPPKQQRFPEDGLNRLSHSGERKGRTEVCCGASVISEYDGDFRSRKTQRYVAALYQTDKQGLEGDESFLKKMPKGWTELIAYRAMLVADFEKTAVRLGKGRQQHRLFHRTGCAVEGVKCTTLQKGYCVACDSCGKLQFASHSPGYTSDT